MANQLNEADQAMGLIDAVENPVAKLAAFFVNNRVSSFDAPKNGDQADRLFVRFGVAAELAESLGIVPSDPGDEIEMAIYAKMKEYILANEARLDKLLKSNG